jgi:FkbM family methyltransferase
MQTPTKKLKILFAGATGYGNIGDDSYKTIFQRYLSGKYDLYFDSPFPDLSLVDLCDYVVIGGGGLIYNNSTPHFKYMTSYLDRAILQKKPFAFLSCGVQIVNASYKFPLEKVQQMGIEQLQGWKPYLEKADIITVRSPSDVKIIKGVAPTAKVFYFPDLAYLLDKVTPEKSHIKPNSVIFIPTKTSCKNPEFDKWWETFKNMPNRYIVAFASDDYDIVDELSAKISDKSNLVTKKYLSPDDACNILRKARSIVTGRYHGAVIARSVGIPEENIHSTDLRYKTRVEKPPVQLSDAEQHINYFLPLLNGGSIEKSYDGTFWNIRPESKIGGCTQDRLGFNKREEYNFKVLKENANQEKIFVDIGAHVGGFSVRMAKLYKQCWAFEPESFNFRGLKLNCELNQVHRRVKCFNLAVSDYSGVGSIKPRGGGSTVKKDTNNTVINNQIPVIKLDGVEFPYEVAAIKIDTEGCEMQVLRGAKHTLKKYHPLVLIETHEFKREGLPGQIAEIKQFMTDLGYSHKVLEITPNKDEHLLFTHTK